MSFQNDDDEAPYQDMPVGDKLANIVPEPSSMRKGFFYLFVVCYLAGVLGYSIYMIIDLGTTAMGFRIGFLTLFCLVGLMYLTAAFLNPVMYVADLMVAPEENPAAVWASMSPSARHAAMAQSGWFTAMNIVGYGMFVCEGGTVLKSLCKCYSLIFVMWQPFWYLGCVGRVDYDSEDKKKTAMDYFKKESIQEIVLFIVFFILGFLPID